MSRKIVNILWSVKSDHWEYRKAYEDGAFSCFIPTSISIFTPEDHQDFKKTEVALQLIGTIEEVSVNVSHPSLFSVEVRTDGGAELVRHFLRRLNFILCKIKEDGFAPERKISFSRAAFSVYADLIDLGAKAWADQLFKKHGVDHTKKSAIPSA